MALTAKQEAFAQAVASGMTQADAYRTAYDCENSSDEVIWNNASALMKHGEVSVRVKSLKEEIACAALWSRLDSVQTLAEIARGEEARANEKVSAIKELNAMHGFNAPTKHEVAGNFTLNICFD
jgi:murein L,D-transpeptidase YcbB/YkuD